MQKLYKFIQQGAIALVITGASVGVVLAAPSFNITTLVSGFIRYTSNNPGNSHEGCKPDISRYYCYGYGWSGNLQAWGFGYGYKSKDFSGEVDTTQAAAYGFDGDDGSVTIDSVDVTQTTATITFSTNYLATFAWAITSGYPLTMENVVVIHDNTSDYFSGTQQISSSGLTCATTYFFTINARDAARNVWSKEGSFTTSPCDTAPTHNTRETVGGHIKSIESISNNKPLSLRIPAIFLSLGSVGIDVQDLQILLNTFGTLLDTHGQAGSPGNETQYFGHKTESALKRFQSIFHLNKVDGIYGPETQRAMYEELVR